MPQTYYAITTDIGVAAIANATVEGKKINLTHFAVGDGNGTYYTPVSIMTTLKKETWRGVVTQCSVDEFSPNIINISAVVPSDVGGFTIRELAVFDNTSKMIAIANCPDTPKVAISEGVSSELEVTMQIVVSNTESVKIEVDPTVIIATKSDVQKVKVEVTAELRNHINDMNFHVSSTEKQKWNTASELSQTNEGEINALNIKINQTNIHLNRLEDSLFNDIIGNPFMVDFKTLTGLVVTKGCWNKTLQRLEC